MPKPIVSILIPCFNSESMLEHCLASCIGQTYRPIEIIIVDNNSNDQSPQIIEQMTKAYPDLIKTSICKQQGANYARNQAFSLSQGEFIQWLDSDDELASNKIERQVAALEENPDFGIAQSDTRQRIIGNDGPTHDLLVPTQQFDDNLRHLLEHYWLPPHAYLLRRSVAEQMHEIQAWEPSRPCLQDAEYFLCAAAIGHRFLYVTDAEAIYNEWSSQQTRQTSFFTKERAEARKEIHDRVKQLYLEHNKAVADPQILFLFDTDANLWRFNTTKARSPAKLDSLDESEAQLLNLLLTLEEFDPAPEGRTFEVYSELLLFAQALFEWSSKTGTPLNPQTVDEFRSTAVEVPFRPSLQHYGIWSHIKKALERFSALGILEIV